MHLRRAVPEDAPQLSTLMFHSKAYWGYSDDFMERFRTSVTISSEDIAQGEVFVLENDEGKALGFCHLKFLKDNQTQIHLEDLFIAPKAIGTGCGKLLFEHAVATARSFGYREITLESDPNAEEFYVKMGARRVSLRESSIPGRFLPQMIYTIPE